MDLLKRSLAPVTSAAWEQIDAEARRVLALHLAGRRVVDVDGPHGWHLAAVNLGRIDIQDADEPGVPWGIRAVQPLVELRVPIVLPVAELDNAARGAALELEPVVAAATKIAAAEDRCIFHGLAAAGMRGILPASPHAPVPLPPEPAGYPAAVVEALEVLRRAGIDGPCALVLGPVWHAALLRGDPDAYPVAKHLRHILEGPIVRAPQVEGGVLVAMRGGDFVLTVGQDLSIGYADHDRHRVELYLTESFAFRVLEPAAAVRLAPR